MHEVVILGAGMSGLCMAVQLRHAGITDFVVLEQQPGLGGTWWDNRYPGAHVDVPAPLYSFSFAPNPHWSRRFAAAPEIQAYMAARGARARRAAAHPLRHRGSRRRTGTRPPRRGGCTPPTARCSWRALLRLQHRAAEPAALARDPGAGELRRPAAALGALGRRRAVGRAPHRRHRHRFDRVAAGAAAGRGGVRRRRADGLPAHRELGAAAPGPPLHRAGPGADAAAAGRGRGARLLVRRAGAGAAAVSTRARWRGARMLAAARRHLARQVRDTALRDRADASVPAGLQAHRVLERLLPGADAAARGAGDRRDRAHHARRGRAPPTAAGTRWTCWSAPPASTPCTCWPRSTWWAAGPHAGEAWRDGPEAWHGMHGGRASRTCS